MLQGEVVRGAARSTLLDQFDRGAASVDEPTHANLRDLLLGSRLQKNKRNKRLISVY